MREGIQIQKGLLPEYFSFVSGELARWGGGGGGGGKRGGG